MKGNPEISKPRSAFEIRTAPTLAMLALLTSMLICVAVPKTPSHTITVGEAPTPVLETPTPGTNKHNIP